MKKLNKALKIAAVLVVLVVFWIFYFVLQFIYSSPANTNLNFIPSKAHTVIAFNGDLAIKTVLNDFISSEDEDLLDILNESRGDLKQSTGIDILSDIILFRVIENNKEMTGLLVNLTSENDFKSNFNSSAHASNSTVGVVIFNDDPKSKSKSLKLATSILKAPSTIYSKKLASKRKKDNLISIWTRTVDADNWNCANVSMKGSSIKLKGTVAFDKHIESDFTRLNVDNASFNVSAYGIIPNALSDSIVKFLQIQNNTICGFSANYRSLKIEQEKSFEIVPDGDFLFQYEKPINISELLRSALENELITDLTQDRYFFGGKLFYYNQKTEKSFYIGRRKVEDVHFSKSKSIISLVGNPRYLSKIEGSPLMVRLMNIFPAYRMGNSLSKSIKSIDIDAEMSSEKTVQVEGAIQFQHGKYASVEFIRNLLELR